MAGTVGAIFNGALQLGSAIGISAVGSIESSVEEKQGGPAGYAGRAASFWFLLGIGAVEFIAMLVFYRISKEGAAAEEEEEEVASEIVQEKKLGDIEEGFTEKEAKGEERRVEVVEEKSDKGVDGEEVGVEGPEDHVTVCEMQLSRCASESDV